MLRSFLVVLALMFTLPVAARDPHSYANTEAFTLKTLELDLSVDFEKQVLHGSALLDFNRHQAQAQHLVLDTRALDIEAVSAGSSPERLKPVRFRIGKADAILGSALRISLPRSATLVQVRYRTRPEASGLQWLGPQQTASGQPFLYSQSQAIHARSWVPLQDTPGVRFTYRARIRTPQNLLAVMGAENALDALRNGDYRFAMPQAIPSYLMALAVGDLHFAPVGKRSGIYAEPSMLAAATKEFEDLEAMIEKAEALYGPYRWGRFDMLILPPAFPFGGMENPRLTFASPTVIAGDKSLVALAAHELAHSWSGNLVTNATWRDFWLNEGFTSYFTNRIMEAVFGQERGDMERVLESEELLRDFPTLPAKHRVMAPAKAAKDPEDYSSIVAYNQGSLMLYTLEQRYGRERFDAFLKAWFNDHAFTSQTTEVFLAYVEKHLLSQPSERGLTAQHIKDWITQPQLSPHAILPSSDAFSRVALQRDEWLAGKRSTAELPIASWNALHWAYFLDSMPSTVSQAQLAELDTAAGLTTSKNRFRQRSWLPLAIRQNYQTADGALELAIRDHALSVGRTYLISSMYEELAKRPGGLAKAKALLAEAEAGYHPITRSAIGRRIEAAEAR